MTENSGNGHTAPTALAGLAVAAVLGAGVTLTGLAQTDNQQPARPAPAITARLGAACGTPGLRALAEDGRHLACTTTLVDRSPRWRSGQLELPGR